MKQSKKLVPREKNPNFADVYVEKSYGPFTVEKPVQLSVDDTYKFAVLTLLNTKFNLLSGERISGIGCRIIKMEEKQNLVQKMGSLKLESYLLNKQRPIKRHGVNTCVVDYVWDQVKGKRGFKTYDYNKLKDEIYVFVPEGDMINTEELINWVRACHNNVSIHAFDSRYKKFIKHIGTKCRDVSLIYIVKDNHCFPVTNERLKLIASKANQGGCNYLLKHMTT